MLFQPTSITPDHLGSLGNGIVDPSLPLTVSWLVNGNSAMTAFQIDYYYNNAASTLIRSTGKLTTGCPFYGTDAQGNKQFFTYTDTAVNLNTTTEWKMVITQWWSASDSVVQSSPSAFTVKAAPSLYLDNLQTVTTRDYTFTATYSQANNDALNWVRWQIAVNSDEGKANPLYDSGNIYGTALLSCYYDGFIPGTAYCIKISIETQSGVQKETEWTGFLCYYTMGELNGDVTASQAVCGATGIDVSWDGVQYIYGTATGTYSISNGILNLPHVSSVTWDSVTGEPMSLSTPWNIIYKLDLTGTTGTATADLLTIAQSGGDVVVRYNPANRTVYLRYGNTNLASIANVKIEDTLTMAITPTQWIVRQDTAQGGLYPSETLYPATNLYPVSDGEPINIQNTKTVSYTQNAITGITLHGFQKCYYIVQVTGTLPASVTSSILNGTYTPELIEGCNFLCDFTRGLNAGTLYIDGTEIDGWAIYRQQGDNQSMMHITDVPLEQSEFCDYSVRSQQGPYTYYVYPIGTQTYVTSPLVSNSVSPVFWNWSILECSFDENTGVYVVENEFLFGKNLESGSVSNNNNPSILQNFTQFPTVQLSPHNYRTGTLTSYIGTTAMGTYSDTLAQRDAIEKLSTTTNSLFLKNRKGDLMEIRLAEAIAFDTDDNTREQALTVNISWVQIYDATETSIIANATSTASAS